MSEVAKKSNIISAMFLVGGTCIGGGMLALPIATGISGFLPSLAVMTVCWLAMTATALLLLEVSLWMEEGVHVITMSSRLLGLPARVVSWILYLFICYASLVAYTAAGGVQVAQGVTQALGIEFSRDWGAALFVIAFGGVIYLGSHTVGRVNSILFIALIAAYLVLVSAGSSEVKPALLVKQNWSTALLALPLLLTSFSFQTMVPSLTPYLKKHVKGLRLAIIGGTFIAFLVYAIWEALILGIVPIEGPNGLAEALMRAESPTQFLSEHVRWRWIGHLAEFFAFFAIVTSFLGMALGLFDFLADGLHIKKQGWGSLALGLLIAAPTLVCAILFERIFLLALDTSGGYGDTILNGLIPVMMVWVGRYKMGYNHAIQLPGGKAMLIAIAIFFGSALCMEIAAHAKLIPSLYDAYELLEQAIPELKEESA